MTILLIGHHQWVDAITRIITDRTTHSPRNKVLSGASGTNFDSLMAKIAGTQDHIEIVMETEGWEPNARQVEAIWHASNQNERWLERKLSTHPRISGLESHIAELKARIARDTETIRQQNETIRQIQLDPTTSISKETDE